MHLKMSSAKWRPSCLGLNVLKSNEMRLCFILLLLMMIMIPTTELWLKSKGVRLKDVSWKWA